MSWFDYMVLEQLLNAFNLVAPVLTLALFVLSVKSFLNHNTKKSRFLAIAFLFLFLDSLVRSIHFFFTLADSTYYVVDNAFTIIFLASLLYALLNTGGDYASKPTRAKRPRR